MKKLIIELFLKVCASIFIGFCIYLFTSSLLVSTIISGLLIAFLLGKLAYKVFNRLFRRSEKLRCYFGFTKFLNRIPQNLEIVNLGSSSGKYAFEYDNSIKGANWALSPQTLYYDFNILKQFYSYLKPNAFVIVSLCPFSSCIKNFSETRIKLKYYSFLHPAMIYEYSKEIYKTISSLKSHPIFLSCKLIGFESFIRCFITSLIKLHPSMLSSNPMNEDTLEKDAKRWIKGWKEQFNINDLDSENISEETQNVIQYNAKLLSTMTDFCKERDLKLVFVLPPVTKTLSLNFSDSFKELYIYSLFADDNMKEVQFLNYFVDERFSNSDLYFNSYFLNAKGRKLFTNQVIKDIKL